MTIFLSQKIGLFLFVPHFFAEVKNGSRLHITCKSDKQEEYPLFSPNMMFLSSIFWESLALCSEKTYIVQAELTM